MSRLLPRCYQFAVLETEERQDELLELEFAAPIVGVNPKRIVIVAEGAVEEVNAELLQGRQRRSDFAGRLTIAGLADKSQHLLFAHAMFHRSHLLDGDNARLRFGRVVIFLHEEFLMAEGMPHQPFARSRGDGANGVFVRCKGQRQNRGLRQPRSADLLALLKSPE